METVVTVFALLIVAFLVLGAYATVKAVRAAKRGVDRTIDQARRTVEHHTLRAKSLAQPGPVGEISQLRLRLRTSMRATQDALHAGVAEDESLRESIGLFKRLSEHGHELDGELKRLEAEPDRAKLAERLPALRERTARITSSADSLRWAAQDRARRFAEDDLDNLSTQIDVETGALRHWTTTDPAHPPHTANRAGRAPDSPPPSRTSDTPPGPPAADPTWPEAPGADAGQEQAPPAITPPGPSPTYPWQKEPRPESTA